MSKGEKVRFEVPYSVIGEGRGKAGLVAITVEVRVWTYRDEFGDGDAYVCQDCVVYTRVQADKDEPLESQERREVFAYSHEAIERAVMVKQQLFELYGAKEA